MLDFDEHIGSLLAVLASLRLLVFDFVDECPTENVLAFINRAPHLEYFATNDCYWKRIGGEWVICDETEFPMHVL